jgi:hypothetical protein
MCRSYLSLWMSDFSEGPDPYKSCGLVIASQTDNQLL